MSRHWSHSSSLTIASLLVAFTGSARAADIDTEDESGACQLTGSLSVHDDKTTWSLVVSDLRGEGYDCYARIVVHRGARSDSEFRSLKTHGEGDSLASDSTRMRSQTTGATLYLCVDGGSEGDDCTEVAHVDES